MCVQCRHHTGTGPRSGGAGKPVAQDVRDGLRESVRFRLMGNFPIRSCQR